MSRPNGRAWRRLCAQAKTYYAPTCHLCGQAIDMHAPHNTPQQWTLDHLDPYKTHGPDVPTIDRVRPAHRGCNSRRHADPLVEHSPRSEEW